MPAVVDLDAARDELNRAEAARAAGNEGMARVCARRAAGLALGVYLARSPGLHWGPAAFDRLRAAQLEPRLPDPVRRAAERLTTRITHEHLLPFPDDPIEDARAILEFVASGSP